MIHLFRHQERTSKVSFDNFKDFFFGDKGELITFNPEILNVIKLRFREFETWKFLFEIFQNGFRIKPPKMTRINEILSFDPNKNVQFDNSCHRRLVLDEYIDASPSASSFNLKIIRYLADLQPNRNLTWELWASVR